MFPELKQRIMNNAFQASDKIDKIFDSYSGTDKKMDVKDLEDIKRYAEIIKHLTDALNKDFY